MFHFGFVCSILLQYHGELNTRQLRSAGRKPDTEHQKFGEYSPRNTEKIGENFSAVGRSKIFEDWGLGLGIED